MSMVFLATGNVSFGMNKRNEAGEIVESTPAAFEHKDGGPCVIVGQLDPDTMQQVGPATPYLRRLASLQVFWAGVADPATASGIGYAGSQSHLVLCKGEGRRGSVRLLHEVSDLP
jgi:hypothetical protein